MPHVHEDKNLKKYLLFISCIQLETGLRRTLLLVGEQAVNRLTCHTRFSKAFFYTCFSVLDMIVLIHWFASQESHEW